MGSVGLVVITTLGTNAGLVIDFTGAAIVLGGVNLVWGGVDLVLDGVDLALGGVALIVLGIVSLVLGTALDFNDLVDDASEVKRLVREARGSDEACDDFCDDSDVT